MEFEGLGTQLWTFEARLNLNIGATVQHKTFRTKIRDQILKIFKVHLSCEEFSLFKSSFSRITKMLLIEEDLAPFTEAITYAWTRDGLPEMDDVGMSIWISGATRPAMVATVAAPGGGSSSSVALLPWPLLAGLRPLDGGRFPAPASQPVVREASPPLTGACWPRGPATPPASAAPDKQGHPVSVNKTAPKTA